MSSIETYQKPTYDVLPSPQGSWKADYDKKNARANTVLAIGVVLFGATVVHSCMDPLQPVLESDLPIDPRTPVA